MTTRALLGLGSNLGNRVQTIQQALALLSTHPGIEVLDTSRLYQTQPIDMADAKADWFINAAVLIDTELSPQALLQTCLAIERQLGRQRTPQSSGITGGYASRTLDIDLLFYDNAVIRETNLDIPHPRLHERAFILAPLADIAPDWLHPTLNKTVTELYLAQPDRHTVQPLATSTPA
jgi:2-amino-4-hydroxy-6-hydroxymethyldihydropteridine diphosphokinase